jgi:hypothetical protein
MNADLAALQHTVAELQDREAIRLVLTGIARGADRFDQAMLAACIHADAKLDMGGPNAITGAAFVEMLKPPAKPPQGRMHMLSNERIVLDGDSAWSETQVLSCQQIEDSGVVQTRLRAGRYLDRFRRCDGVWKLSERTFIDEWARTDTIDAAPAMGANRGAPAPHDLLYKMFGPEASQ